VIIYNLEMTEAAAGSDRAAQANPLQVDLNDLKQFRDLSHNPSSSASDNLLPSCALVDSHSAQHKSIEDSHQTVKTGSRDPYNPVSSECAGTRSESNGGGIYDSPSPYARRYSAYEPNNRYPNERYTNAQWGLENFDDDGSIDRLVAREYRIHYPELVLLDRLSHIFSHK
jgi:hypothetical protein